MASPAERSFLYPTAMPPPLPGLYIEEMSLPSVSQALPAFACLLSMCVHKAWKQRGGWDLLVREPLVSKKWLMLLTAAELGAMFW